MLKKKIRIGIVGCGAIGSSLAKVITRDFRKNARLSALFDIEARKSLALSKIVFRNSLLACDSLDKLVKRSELVIEAASGKSSFGIAKKALENGCDVMMMSVGGVIGNFNALYNLADKRGRKVYIPSGAISGIDALKAAGLGRLKSVTLTTRKHPLSFQGVEYIRRKKIDLGKIKKDTLLFSGSAKEAVKFFPQNINVAAILSIAGMGQERTKIKIIASPKTKKNIHEVKIESEAANITTCTENVLHPDNPKTSFLAVLSAVAVLKQILGPVKIGT